MNFKYGRTILYALLLTLSSLCAAQAQAQAVTFSLENGATVADLSALGGTVADKAVRSVGVFIGKADSDEEWDGANRWVTGPTGRWLKTKLRADRTWAPLFTLPRGERLPAGAYNLIAIGFDRSGRAVGEQVRLTVHVRR